MYKKEIEEKEERKNIEEPEKVEHLAHNSTVELGNHHSSCLARSDPLCNVVFLVLKDKFENV